MNHKLEASLGTVMRTCLKELMTVVTVIPLPNSSVQETEVEDGKFEANLDLIA